MRVAVKREREPGESTWTTWKGRPPATGSGTCPTTEAMKYSRGQGSDDRETEKIWHRYRRMALETWRREGYSDK